MRLAVLSLLAAALGFAAARVGSEPPVVARELSPPPPRSAPPPRVRPSSPRVIQRELSPTDRRYDPVALADEMRGALSVQDIFASEPRDERHAPIMEQRARAVVERTLRELEIEELVTAVAVECRTLSCEVRLEASPDRVADVYARTNGVMLGDIHAPSIDATSGEVVITTMNRPASRDDAYYARFVREAVEPAIEAAKRGGE